ncbi:MAG: polysaccharide deacetylase family protein [Candidatus Scatosoma sp.]
MAFGTFNRSFMRFPQFKRKALTLSYDDGVPQDKRLLEIMKKNGLRGTFNINSELFEEVGPFEVRFRMSKAETIELFTATNNEIAVHGAKHLPLANVDTATAINDIIGDRKNLEKMFGRMINGMAYAYGSYNDEIVETLKKCGILYARTVKNSLSFDIPTDWLRLAPTCHHNHPKLMETAREFVENETDNALLHAPLLFYLWGHSFEFDRNNNWYVIENFAEYMGNREDIWYATNGEIYHYVQAYDSLRTSVEGDLCFNPSGLDVYLCYGGKNIKIPAGETVRL